MANLLESLAGHYDQMSTALHEQEAGEEFSEEDIQRACRAFCRCSCRAELGLISSAILDLEMHRDTDELPAIVIELEESIAIIEASQ